MERVGARRTSTTKAAVLGLHAVPDPDHRLDDRAGGQARRGPAEDRPRHLQPALSARHAAADRRHAALRPAARRSRIGELRQIDTPYNTYLHTGLPPTPIANPGRASIQAALNPAPNPTPGDPICVGAARPDEMPVYLYYVLADEDGSHAFAATLEQHEANVAAAPADLGLLG